MEEIMHRYEKQAINGIGKLGQIKKGYLKGPLIKIKIIHESNQIKTKDNN
jgi:hypothetical protein